jgi:hypothetical protein
LHNGDNVNLDIGGSVTCGVGCNISLSGSKEAGQKMRRSRRPDQKGASRAIKTFSCDLSDTVFAVQCQICATDRSGREPHQRTVDETLRFRWPFLAIAKICEARIVRAPEALPFN